MARADGREPGPPPPVRRGGCTVRGPLRRRPRRAILPLLVLLVAVSAVAIGQDRPPHVVLIVADDLGYSDLGSYGGEIDTPQLDRLALAGVRLTRFYVTPRCSPTRAALLTGRWPHQAGVGHLNHDWGRPAYSGAIRQEVPTIAEQLRGYGYATYMAGKWHLTPGLSRDGSPPAGEEALTTPLRRGFDRFYGTLAGSGSHFEPPHLYDDDRPARLDAAAGRTLTAELGERGARFVAEHLATSPERPFFLYLAFTAPHWPLHAEAGEIARYDGRFDAGWDALRAARFARMRDLGVIAADAELPPRDPGVEAWTEVAERDWQARRMAAYAAMVTTMDRAVGRVVAALDQRGVLDETLILFLSDNGACAEELRGVYRFAPLVLPIPERTADGREIRVGDEPSIVPGPADTFSTYGRGWAHLSNTPLRLYKHWTHEGGIAAPFFVHWPEGLPGRAGAIVHAPAHVVDVAATLIALAARGEESADAGDGDRTRNGGAGGGGNLRPADGDTGDEVEAREHHAASRSLLPLLRGQELEPRTMFWEHEGNRAVLDGRWKLVSRWPGSWELFDLEADRSETTDLAAADPDRVAALDRAWQRWAAAVGVEPWPLVVPELRTAISIAGAVLFVLLTIARSVRARRAEAPSSRPRRAGGDARDAPRQPRSSPPPRSREEESRRRRAPATRRGDADRPPPIVPR
jgi:arylsulfatase